MQVVKRNINWHGVDVKKSISLFEYGLLLRWKPKQKSWQCVYLSNQETKRYSYGWIDNETLDEIFTKGWGTKHLKSFMDFCGHYWEDWKELPMCHRLSDFIDYFGCDEIFSTDFTGGYNAKEICKKLKIKNISED